MMNSGLQSRGKQTRRVLLVLGLVLFAMILWNLFNAGFLEKEKDIRIQIRESVSRWFPDQSAEVNQLFGLKRYTHPNEDMDAADERALVLIHGLDDPGKVWISLAPASAEKKYKIWQMQYPNDQPIKESAAFFTDQLAVLKEHGIKRIAIVAHSMGGLVTREMLTSPDLLYSKKVTRGQVPEVSHFIMVGTPNHGSQLARFRSFAEFRDQWVHLTKGEGHWLRWILDGAGEAKIDLLPDSQFLNTLNARPHPEGIRMFIIAGKAVPWTNEDSSRMTDTLESILPEKAHQLAGDLDLFLNDMSNGLGDGLVTVASTKLEGIPHKTLDGTHLSIIRNISEESRRIPPAVPLILDILGREFR